MPEVTGSPAAVSNVELEIAGRAAIGFSEGHACCANSLHNFPCCTAGCRRRCKRWRCSWPSARSGGAGDVGARGHYRWRWASRRW
jgi:hypothetical protein